jgi:hypothetical protein
VSLGFTGVTIAIVAIVVGALAFTQRPNAGGPVTGVATDGPFRLTISIPHASYPVGTAITGITASLEYTGPAGSISISHAKQLLGFAVASEDGRHRTEPAWAQSCGRSELSGKAPASAAFVKSGGYFPEASDYPWLQTYFGNPSLVLDRGRWTITAVAQFDEGDCGGRPSHDIRASAAIDVTGPPSALLPATLGPSLVPTPVAVHLAHFDGDGFGFEYPASWDIVASSGHLGIHGPTLEAAVGIGDFSLGCSSTSTSISCPADPIWSVPHTGVLMVYRFPPWLGMCPAFPSATVPADDIAYVGGRQAVLTVGERSMTWAFLSAPDLIEVHWGDGNDTAPADIAALMASWRWVSQPCALQPSSAPS